MGNHVVHVSDSKLVTIAGGKWTTYRAMASETVDTAVEAASLGAGPSMTDGLMLEGAHNWAPTMFIRLVQDLGVDTGVAQHLSDTYGGCHGVPEDADGERPEQSQQRQHPCESDQGRDC